MMMSRRTYVGGSERRDLSHVNFVSIETILMSESEIESFLDELKQK